MSKGKERAEKICLNCNAELYDRYCHKCGQQNTEPKHSVWSLISHFFYDITHFDGKFFSTLKYLVKKPGFLSSEYIKGRRNSYLDPIRMYVFSSALFFLIFFSIFSIKPGTINTDGFVDDKAMAKVREEAYKNATTRADSAAIDSGFSFVDRFAPPIKDTAVKMRIH